MSAFSSYLANVKAIIGRPVSRKVLQSVARSAMQFSATIPRMIAIETFQLVGTRRSYLRGICFRRG